MREYDYGNMMERKYMRAISLDVGDKTIGVALSDSLGITANGLMTIERVGIRKDADKVLALVKEHRTSSESGRRRQYSDRESERISQDAGE